MNPRWLLILILVAPPTAWPATEIPSTAPKRPPLTERVEALLGPHLKPVSLPVTLPNPFVMVRRSAEFTTAPDAPPAAPVPPPSPAVEDIVALGDAEVLTRCIAHLKIGGTMQVNDSIQLMINGDLCKAGDHITLEAKPQPIYVQVVHVSATELTLRYRDATQTIRLKSPSPKSKDPES